jgi:hypothetical protein
MPNINAGTQTSGIQLKETTTPSTPASGFLKLFADTSSNFDFIDDSGRLRQVMDSLIALLAEQATPGTPASGFGRFWVDTDGRPQFINDAGVTMPWVRIATGSYTGDGTDDRNITGVGFTPRLVWIETAIAAGGYRFATSGDVSYFHTANFGGASANVIQAMNSDGFQVGNSSRVNGAAVIFFWIAIG